MGYKSQGQNGQHLHKWLRKSFRHRILSDFWLQTEKIFVVNKQNKTAEVVDVTMPSYSGIRRKEHEKLKQITEAWNRSCKGCGE